MLTHNFKDLQILVLISITSKDLIVGKLLRSFKSCLKLVQQFSSCSELVAPNTELVAFFRTTTSVVRIALVEINSSYILAFRVVILVFMLFLL